MDTRIIKRNSGWHGSPCSGCGCHSENMRDGLKTIKGVDLIWLDPRGNGRDVIVLCESCALEAVKDLMCAVVEMREERERS